MATRGTGAEVRLHSVAGLLQLVGCNSCKEKSIPFFNVGVSRDKVTLLPRQNLGRESTSPATNICIREAVDYIFHYLNRF